MIISTKVESKADPVIFRCLPSRVRFTFSTGAISNNLTNCFGGLFWLIKKTKSDVTPYPVRAAESPYNNISAEKGKKL